MKCLHSSSYQDRYRIELALHACMFNIWDWSLTWLFGEVQFLFCFHSPRSWPPSLCESIFSFCHSARDWTGCLRHANSVEDNHTRIHPSRVQNRPRCFSIASERGSENLDHLAGWNAMNVLCVMCVVCIHDTWVTVSYQNVIIILIIKFIIKCFKKYILFLNFKTF